MISFKHSGLGVFSPSAIRAASIVLLVSGQCALCSAQSRVLDLSGIGPDDFEPMQVQPVDSTKPDNDGEPYFLPPIPLTDLNELKSEKSVEVEETQAEKFEVEQSDAPLAREEFLLPPAFEESNTLENAEFLPPIVKDESQTTVQSQVSEPEVEETAADSANTAASNLPDEDPFAWAREVISTATAKEQLEFLPPIVKEAEEVESVLVPPAIDEAFAQETLLIPPAAEQPDVEYASAEELAETLGNVEVELASQVSEVASETLSAVTGEYEVLSPEPEDVIEHVSYVEMPILATHKVMGVAHRCTTALQSPVPASWIFWRKQKCERTPGPICCRLQSCFVNWRLNSIYLKGCIPEGYSLQNFIQTAPNVEYHGSALIEGGPVDPGGNFEDAKKIEGEETRPIQQVSINITPPEGALPEDRAEEKFEELPDQLQLPGTHRLWCGTSFYWNASLLNHQPLYFEDVNLERNGFSRGCIAQPLVSGMKFFGTLPALPYLMTASPPQEPSFTLGQARPGSHACYVCERPRLRLDAAAVEAAAVVGLVFLIP